MRETTNNVRGKVIVGSLTEMAKVLGLKTVADGVETLEQVELLQGVGCDVAQGFYFARLMALAAFESLAK